MDERPQVVAITGASGYIGARLLQELEKHEELGKMVAIDVKPLPLPVHNISAHRLDVTQPLDELFRNHHVTTVVHLVHVLRPGRGQAEVESIRNTNVTALHNVLKACHAARVRSFVYLSSHTVYGAHRDNPVPITEGVPLRPMNDFQYSYDKAMCERIIQEFTAENPNMTVTVLRSCVVMGPNANNYVTRAFFKPVLLGVSGYDPPLQFVHEDDMAQILCTFAMEPQPGVFNVAGDRVIHYSQMAQLAHRRLIFLPSVMAYPLAQLTWNMGVQKDSPSVGLDFVRYPLVLSTGKLKSAIGFHFYYTSEETVSAFIASNMAR